MLHAGYRFRHPFQNAIYEAFMGYGMSGIVLHPKLRPSLRVSRFLRSRPKCDFLRVHHLMICHRIRDCVIFLPPGAQPLLGRRQVKSDEVADRIGENNRPFLGNYGNQQFVPAVIIEVGDNKVAGTARKFLRLPLGNEG
jgi:hypothetical protein